MKYSRCLVILGLAALVLCQPSTGHSVERGLCEITKTANCPHGQLYYDKCNLCRCQEAPSNKVECAQHSCDGWRCPGSWLYRGKGCECDEATGVITCLKKACHLLSAPLSRISKLEHDAILS